MGAGASAGLTPEQQALCEGKLAELKAEYEGKKAANASEEELKEFTASAEETLKAYISEKEATTTETVEIAKPAEEVTKEAETPVVEAAAVAVVEKPPQPEKADTVAPLAASEQVKRRGSAGAINAPVAGKSQSTKTEHKPQNYRGLAKGKSKKMGGGGRRRSYGEDSMAALVKPKETADSDGTAGVNLAVSASLPALDTAATAAVADGAAALAAMQAMNAEISGSPKKSAEAEPDQDHWDSVSQLPYCECCQMAFKTASALDRHVKYSNLHETTVKKIAEAAAEPTVEEKKKELSMRQEEGKDFRLLYYGSKFFWRTQDNIDLSFYQHIMMHCIEIVPFDVYKNKELARIYLDKFLLDSVLESSVKAIVAKKKEKMLDDRRTSKFTQDEFVFDDDAEFIAQQRLSATTYILARLQLHHVGTGDKKPGSKMVFHTLNDDIKMAPEMSSIDPLLKEVPDLLIPVSMTHRRNTSSQEVSEKMNELHAEQKSLKSSIGKAEKIAGHMQIFVQIAKDAKRMQALTPGLRRFIMAVRKVIQINCVERTKKVLEALEKKDFFKKVAVAKVQHEAPL